MLRAQVSTLFFKGARWYASAWLSHCFEWAIIILSIFILADFVRIGYKAPDLTGADASKQLLRGAYSMNYIMQRVSTEAGALRAAHTNEPHTSR